MEHFIEGLIPLAGIVFCVGLPIVGFVFLLWKNGENKHQEKLRMIEKNLVPEEKPKIISTTNTLRNGMIMLGLGIGAIIGFVLGEFLEYDKETFAVVVFSSAITFGGLALCICYFILSGKTNEKTEDYGDDMNNKSDL